MPGGGIEQKREKREEVLMDTDNSVGTWGGRLGMGKGGRGYRGINGDRKNTIIYE